LEQRVAAYRQGGYEMVSYTPFQVTMAQGKGLGFFWWLVAMLSGVGFLWYLVIMLTSGFSKDRVYLIVERDGTLYEDGAGAAHVRRHRARVGRRWGFLGVVVFFIALLWFMAMMGVGVYGVENYRPELEAAYPEVTLFASDEVPPDAASLDPERLQTAESGVVAFSVLFVLCLLCLLAGLTMTIVGYLHSSAYDVEVMPLPVYQ
jgi:amino acid transporter